MRGIDKIAVCFIMGALLCAAGCKEPEPDGTKDGKEFEGVITYRLSYEGRDDRAVYGDTMRLYYSKGNIAKVYNSQGPEALRKEVFICDKHLYLAQKALSDTVLTYDLRQKSLEVKSTKRSSDDTRILGHVCKTIEHRSMHSDPNFYVSSSMSYSKNFLRVDKLRFKDWNFGSFNSYIDEAGCLYLRSEMKIQYYGFAEPVVKIATAVDIKEQRVDPGIFHVDTTITKPLIL